MEQCCLKKNTKCRTSDQHGSISSEQPEKHDRLLCLLFVFHKNNSAEKKVVHPRWCGEAIKNPMINDFEWDCSYQKNPPRADLLP